jgi:sulfide:quinone oxidoreductase
MELIYKEVFFRSHGKIPNWGLPLAKWSAETLKI